MIVPTRNAGALWRSWLSALGSQSEQPLEVIMVDSDSDDDTVALAKTAGISAYSIDKSTFNHGGTRNYAVSLAAETDVLVFLTQDALLASPDALKNILSVFDDDSVAAVCGRQLPHVEANPLATHARHFNYPDKTIYKSSADIPELGIKSAFMSNSFAAYRTTIFKELGGFPSDTILAEDMYLTAKMLLAGYSIVYSSEAVVRHSHNYSPFEEFKRYFDTGVFHACEPWIQKQLGGASGEGGKFVKSELKYLLKSHPAWVPRALFTTFCKFVGYKLGLNYTRIPKSLRPKLGMYKSYWYQR